MQVVRGLRLGRGVIGHLRRVFPAMGLCFLLSTVVCHGPAPARKTDDSPHSVDQNEPKARVPPEPPPPRVEIGVETEEPDRWLFVEAVDKEAVGGWATGSFDPERNKLDIRTHDVRAFAIDVSRIPIRWDRLVILSLDGRNSELRRRDYTLLHFALDDHGQWLVVEP